MSAVVAALDFVFGCHHHHLTRVFTIHGQSYRVCCDCGAEFVYSLTQMSMKRVPSEPRSRCARAA